MLQERLPFHDGGCKPRIQTGILTFCTMMSPGAVLPCGQQPDELEL